MISDTLSYVASRTEEASTKLQASLEKENSLREEVAAKTEALNQSYVDFVTALGDANGKVKESGKEYITKLLDQKRSIMELNKTGTARIAQEGVVKTLEEQKIALEEKLQEVTAKRIEAEEKLQKIQEAFGFLADMISGKFTQMAQTIMQLAQAVAAFNAMAGTAGGVGIGFQPIINQFAGAVAQFNKAAQTAGVASQTTATASTAIAGAGTNIALTFGPKLMAGMQMFGAALSGFSIGSIVGQLTGDMGMGSSIGGALGGIAVAIPAISTAITGAIASAFGAASFATGVLSMAIPVIGPIIGALLGGLFSSKPRGQAQGTLTSEGFETTSMSGKKVDPKALASIADVALTGVVGSLEAAGISFNDTVNTSISFYKKGINGATLEFANGFKASFKGGTAQQAGEFFVNSFFQGLRLGSLSVDETLPAADRIQAAIDNFVTLSDVSEKTAERFSKAVEFASKFDTALMELNGTGTNITQVFAAIENAAAANAANVSRYYSEFLADTRETFGASSSEYAEAYAAAQNNALAQIGLARDLAGNIVTAEQAMSELNTGAVLIKDTIASIEAFRSVLTELDIADVDTQITKAINAKLGGIVSDIGKSLTTSIDKLKNPASAAAYELRDIMEAGAARVTELQGMYDQIRTSISEGADIASNIVSDAASNIAKATELAQLQVEAYISSLDKSGLRAVIANGAWGDAAALAAAQTELAIKLEYERVQAIEKFVDISRDFKKRLSEISGQMVKTADVPISFTATTDVMKAFEQEVSTGLTNSFTGLLNSIGRGDNIVGNFETSIATLNAGLASGELDSLAYANGLEMLQEVSLTVLEELKTMIDEYESLVEQISDSFNQSKDAVLTAIQELGEQVISLTQNISDKTSEILGIYDDTLSSVAESGNELFDLRDTAKEAFSTAAKAVAEFEKSNKLSGRSSATLRGEIVSVQSQLNELLSAGSLDFSGFAQFTELNSKQSALKKELNAVLSVEQEYQKLLDDRSTTQEDLVFVEATLATLNEDLVDTRIKESDVTRKAQEAAVNFVNAQQDLKDITELLAESNFNLNQARFDEESAVSRMRLSLSEFTKDTEALTGILDAVGGEAGSELRTAFIEAAVGNASILYAELGEVAKDIKINEAAQEASAAFAQLEDLVSQVGSYFAPVSDVFVDLESVSLTSLAITDRFKQFNDDLVKYLDQDGLSQFYGEGGVFSTFRQSLLTTLKTDGFDVLTASGGPMDSFNLNLMTIRTAIDTLTQSGSFLDVSIQTVQTSFGNLISALGTDVEGLTSAFAG
jgi:ABC-type transporter Mla subunit MlaD